MAQIWKKTLRTLCCACVSLCAVALAACDKEPAAATKYTVTYNGVSITESTATVEDESLLTKPNDPTREHYVFDGWYNGEEKWDFAADKVTENVTLTAKWTAKVYTVKFVAQDGTTLVEEKTYTCENVNEFAEPAVPAAPEFCTNGRWSKTSSEYLTYSEDVIVVVATYDRVQFDVSFVSNEVTLKTGKVGGNLLIEEKPEDPVKDYYIFDGWYNGEEKWDFAADKVTENVTLTAKWTAKVYTVIVKDAEGEETELTYTAETVGEFKLPPPVAPEDCENARWSKTVEECTVYSETPIVVELLYDVSERAYYKAVVKANEEGDLDALKAAITEYKVYCANLSEEEKADEDHQDYVAEVNQIIADNFYVMAEEKTDIITENVGNQEADGAWHGERHVTHELNTNSKFNNAETYDYGTFSYISGNYSNIKFTLNKINYNAYDEVYFGIAHAMTYETAGSMTIAGETFTVPSQWYGGYLYRMKATISGGVLTVTDDGSQNAAMAVSPYYLQVALSEAVLNGTESLVIEFNTGAAYGWYEVTNMVACTYATNIEATDVTNNAVENTSGAALVDYRATSTGNTKNLSTSYSNCTFVNLGKNNTKATITMDAFDYNNYSEVYFGVAFAVITEKGIITVDGTSYQIPSDLIGHWYYMKAIVKDGYLTLVDDGSSDNIKNSDTNYKQYGYFLKVQLNESVLNGTKGLEIGFESGADWAQIELTDMKAIADVSFVS